MSTGRGNGVAIRGMIKSVRFSSHIHHPCGTKIAWVKLALFILKFHIESGKLVQSAGELKPCIDFYFLDGREWTDLVSLENQVFSGCLGAAAKSLRWDIKISRKGANFLLQSDPYFINLELTVWTALGLRKCALPEKKCSWMGHGTTKGLSEFLTQSCVSIYYLIEHSLSDEPLIFGLSSDQEILKKERRQLGSECHSS